MTLSMMMKQAMESQQNCLDVSNPDFILSVVCLE